jgi:hypothetical protein
VTLNTLSNNTTRRLDNTYYSVLEKLSLLQNTISSLKELAGLTRELNEEFKNESEEIVGDIRVQLDGFQGFEEQEKRIADLQARIVQGRDKIKILGGRVDVVRERVEGWEKAEFEWQEKTRKRLRVLWTLMSIVAVIVIALVVFRHTPARNHPHLPEGMNASTLADKIPSFEQIANDTVNLTRKTVDALEGLKDRDGEELEDDPRLRIFDEL